jgi:hypothetical protein
MITLNLLDWLAINGLAILFVATILIVLLKGERK